MRLTSSQATSIAKLARRGPVELDQVGRDVRVEVAGKRFTVGARGAIKT